MDFELLHLFTKHPYLEAGGRLSIVYLAGDSCDHIWRSFQVRLCSQT